MCLCLFWTHPSSAEHTAQFVWAAVDFIKSIKMVVGSSAVSPAPAQCHGSSPLLSSPSHEYKLSDIAGRGTRCIPSHQHQLKLDNTKYSKIFTNKNEYRQAGGRGRPGTCWAAAKLHNFDPKLWTVFLSNLQTHFVFTQIEGSGQDNNKSLGILSMSWFD